MEHPLSQFKYCPKCGSIHFEINNEKSKRCTDCRFVYYFNPSAATVALIMNEQNELLVCRRAKDPAKGTLDLPGGFIDMAETGEEGVRREVKEETGLTLTSYKLRGLVTFISDKCEPELMCVFTANEYIGELTECNEGELYWIDKAVVPTLPTWEGDRVFLDLLLSGDERFFSLKLQYEGEKLVDKQVNLY